MDKIIDYQVIRSTASNTLANQVSEWLVKGYQPFGSISTTTVFENEAGQMHREGAMAIMYTQAIVKYAGS